MLKQAIAISLCGFTLALTNAYADGFSVELSGGYAQYHFSGNTQAIWLQPAQENQYSVSNNPQSAPLFGIGMAYQWDFHPVSVSLGVTAYSLSDIYVSGQNSPNINVPGGPYDSLDYTASGNSYALMLEPKFILTDWSWQPYLFAGVGVAFNNLSAYVETNPGGQSAPTDTPFGEHTSTNAAYEFGAGLQYALSAAKNAPILTVNGRYMNLGWANVGTAALETSGQTLNFGELHATVWSLGLIMPF